MSNGFLCCDQSTCPLSQALYELPDPEGSVIFDRDQDVANFLIKVSIF